MAGFKICVVLVILLCVFSCRASSVRLAAKSRWIVDEQSGARVKLACVNLISHLEHMVTEGLNRQPLSYIATTVASQGFNCVRLTYATFMVTRPEYQTLTVKSSLNALNLSDAVAQISVSNPELLDLSLLESLKRVAQGLGDAGLMVILDNHVSKPQWCCGLNDGNGFFGDQYFDAHEWIQGWKIMAAAFKDVDAVVGMSLRNELRGPRSNPSDWYKYMQAAAEAIHAANPHVLVVLSGLNYDADLKFLASKTVNLGFREKIVYEMHWYSFTDGNAWMQSNTNQLCGSITARINDHLAFVVKNGINAPLFISEFGIDERGTNVKDNRFINCFLAFAAAGDYEWALWTLQGSYYVRNGRQDVEETYGIFNVRWDGLRNPAFLSRLKSIEQPFQDPFSSEESLYQIVYHPASGNCLAVEGGEVKLESCDSPALFTIKTSEGALGLSDEESCITAEADGQPAALSTQCTDPNSAWRTVSSSKLQIAVNGSSELLCLDGSSSPQVLTKKCKAEDPEMQWFKVIQTNRKQSMR